MSMSGCINFAHSALAARALPWTQLDELKYSPKPLTNLRLPFLNKEKRKGEKGRKGWGKRK